MSCAAFTILFMRIKLEWHSILFCNLGALFGLILGKNVNKKNVESNSNVLYVMMARLADFLFWGRVGQILDNLRNTWLSFSCNIALVL